MSKATPDPSFDILSASDIGMCIVREGKIVYASPGLEKLIGYSAKDLSSAAPFHFVHPEDRPLLDRTVEKLSPDEKPDPLDIRLICKNGDIVRAQSAFTSIQFKNQKAVLISLTDITKRHLQEEKLRWSENKYHSILESIQEVYYETDIHGRITFANSALGRHLGYTKEELIGMSNREYIDEESRKRVFIAFHELYMTGKPVKAIEETIIRKDGSKGVAELSASLIRDTAGNPIGFAGISREITERKQMEETLRQSEERYRTIINEMDEWYFEADLKGNLIFYNDPLARELGYPPEALQGMNFRDIIEADQAETVYGLFHEVFQTGQPLRNVPYRFTHTDGSARNAEFSIFAKRNRQGRIIGFRSVGHDITGKKKAQHQQFLSEKMASISQLVAGGAQKINKPTLLVMSNIKTLAEYFTDIADIIGRVQSLPETLDGGQKEAFEAISRHLSEIKSLMEKRKIGFVLEDIDNLVKESQENIEQAIKVIRELATYGDEGDDRPRLEDINENLETALNHVWNELKYKATVVRDYGDLPKISCRPRQINHVFINLLRNAAQAIEEEGEIKISTREDGKGHIEIRIQDSGTGILEENLSRIFDPFFTTKNPEKSTGLGLHAAFSIIDRHQGKIDVESKPGGGTTFAITLPIDTKAGSS